MSAPLPLRRYFIQALLWCVGVSTAAMGADVVDPGAFDFDRSTTLSEDELLKYVAHRDKLSVDVMALLRDDFTFQPTEKYPTLDSIVAAKLNEAAANGVGEIIEHLGGEPPYPIALVRNYAKVVVAADGTATADESDLPRKIPGLFREKFKDKATQITRGPIYLRKTREGWLENLSDTAGATLSYADDRKAKTKTYTSEGALIYPMVAPSWRIAPSVSWQKIRISDEPDPAAAPATTDAPKDGEADELRFAFSFLSTAKPRVEGFYLSTVEYAPYLLTDGDFRGLLFGLSLTWKPYYRVPGTGFGVNTGYRGMGASPLRYRLTALPKLDFSHIYRSNRFFKRDAREDFLRVGGKLELGFKTRGYPSLELLGSYEFFEGIAGTHQHSELAAVTGKVWFTKNTGVSLERKKGETPVAEKDVNALNLSLEVRF